MYSDVAIIIPSRIDSERLPKKPLELIGPSTMIEHVLTQVKKTGLEDIYVATDSELIAEVVASAGGRFIMATTPCVSGTDRVYEAFTLIPDNNKIKYVINVQGDMPFINSTTILKIIDNLKTSNYDIITPVVKVDREAAKEPSCAKVVADLHGGKALYFSRHLIPYSANEFLYHVGIYGFKAETLEKFVNFPPTYLEQTEKLEQLRALENGMEIGLCYVEEIPLSVDTANDLEIARNYYNNLGITT